MCKEAPIATLTRRYTDKWNRIGGQVYIFIITYLTYVCFRLSRKPISVVKPVLRGSCTNESSSDCGWKPFDGKDNASLLGWLDTTFLITYTIGMFLSGFIADRLNLRVFIAVGCVLSGMATTALGLAYFCDIHSLAHFIIIQALSGLFHSTGFPPLVACFGSWFGKSRRGLLMGFWNTHSSVGNMLGSQVAGALLSSGWGWSFAVPGILIASMGLIDLIFLIPTPEEVGLSKPDSQEVEEVDEITAKKQESKKRGIGVLAALRLPGVIEYSLCMFFSKLVSYTFLYWLPQYINEEGSFDPTKSANLSSLFDVGGIVGCLLGGFMMDQTAASATVCSSMLILGVPMLYVFHSFGLSSEANCIGLLIPLGLLINGPFELIATAVAADLGTNKSLASDKRALATVTGIVNGTGSLGAALGPLICGYLISHGWLAIIGLLMGALALSALLLLRRVVKEIKFLCHRRKSEPDAGETEENL